MYKKDGIYYRIGGLEKTVNIMYLVKFIYYRIGGLEI